MSSLRVLLLGVVAAVCLTASLPALAAAGSISGTVTAEATKAPIAGIQVCANPDPNNYEGFCVETVADGTYEILGLPAAPYSVRFASYRPELNYVAEWYGGAHARPGNLVSVGSGDVSGVDAELEVGGVIVGTLTNAATGGPAAGALACVENDDIFFGLCAKADANGHYLVNRLATAAYLVTFRGDNEASYLTRYYNDTAVFSEADPVSVTAGAALYGVDAVLEPGAQILGHVSQVGTGLPLSDVWVCAEEKGPGDVDRCAFTDESGNYALGSLPAGTYYVGFEPEPLPTGVWADQWWQGAATVEEATPIVIVPPETRLGIDGQIDKPIYGPPPPYVPPGVISTTVPPVAVAPKPRLRSCRKGFHRKLVKGKKRCVRKQRRHRHHRHRLGSER